MQNTTGWLQAVVILALGFASGCSSGSGVGNETDVVLDGFDPAPTTVKVFIGNGHTQCNDDAIPLSQTQMMLVHAGIDVLSSACGVITGVAYPAVCGGGTGEINLHTIRAVNLFDAERMGFRDVAAIGADPQVIGTGYQESACPQ